MDAKRWMVGLDLTKMDEVIIKWVNTLSKKLNPDVIYFIHVEKNLEEVSYIPSEFKDALRIVDEDQENKIQSLLSDHFTNQDVETQIEIVEGNPIESLLHWGSIKKIDLFIFGQKHKENGRGLLPSKLSRKLSSSVLFVPQSAPGEMKNILVPIDFSEHSKMALSTALAYAANDSNISIKCLHIYNVPLGYYKTGKSYEEFKEIMHENALKEFSRFYPDKNSQVRFEAVLEDKVATDLIMDAVIDGIDLVFLGSKGQSFGSLILLGSTTEKLIQTINSCPVWVVKKKGENLGFFEALAKL